jgi:uncharacterized Fe-S cluster protein YjdI/predicted GNAT family acetyltransferase
MDRYREYCSDHIVIRFYPSRCTHAAECVRGLPDVFKPGRKPWIVAHNGTPDEIAEVIRRCPSGALEYELRKPEGDGEKEDGSSDIKMEGAVFYAGDSLDDPLGMLRICFVDESTFSITTVYVRSDLRGKGLAMKLVEAAAGYARDRGLMIIPICPYAKRVMERKEEFGDVLRR